MMKNKVVLSKIIPPFAFLTCCFLVGCASTIAYQPYMQNALSLLEQANAQLAQAAPDKAGMRVQAMSQVNQAIAAVQNGIAIGSM